jgi:hypothetical protein
MKLGAKLDNGKLIIDSDRFIITSDGPTGLYEGIITKFRVTNLGLQINGHTDTVPRKQEHFIIVLHSGSIYVDCL